MKKILFILAIMVIFFSVAKAQLSMNSSGLIGIGSSATNSASSLAINTNGSGNNAVSIVPLATQNVGISYSNSSVHLSTVFGIVSSQDNTGYSNILRSVYSVACSSTAQSCGQAYAIHGIAGNNTNGYNIGIYGQLQGSNNGAAVYGQAGTASAFPLDNMYAGYFYGNVKITGSIWAQSGTITGSDQKLKKNIVVLDSTDKIFNLKPVKYYLKSPRELASTVSKSDTSKTPVSFLPDPDYTKKLHYGFLAQDMQQVCPDLVYTSGDGTLGIDYQGLIPLIIDQLKKMKQSLQDKDARIDSLEQRLNNCCGSSSLKSAKATSMNDTAIISKSNSSVFLNGTATLSQNAPNPFSKSTNIGYYLPESVQNATLYIYNMNGVQIKSIPVTSKGNGNITINGYELGPGMYLYTLIADGQEVATKRMILTQ